MNKKTIMFSALVLGLLMSGCSSKNNCIDGSCTSTNNTLRLEPLETKGYKTKITPTLGTKQNDAKIVRNFGVTLKATIFPYVDKDGNLIGGNDIYIVAKQPEWIIADKEPVKRAKGLKSLAGKTIPVTLRPDELNPTSNIDEKALVEFHEYMNNVETNPELAQKKLDQDMYDEKIANFLKNKKDKDTK